MHTPRWSPPELFTVRLRWDSPTNSNHKQATHRQCLSCFWVYVTCYGKRYSSKYWANICFEHYFVSTKSISSIKKGYLYTPYKSKTSRKSNNKCSKSTFSNNFSNIKVYITKRFLNENKLLNLLITHSILSCWKCCPFTFGWIVFEVRNLILYLHTFGYLHLKTRVAILRCIRGEIWVLVPLFIFVLIIYYLC